MQTSSAVALLCFHGLSLNSLYYWFKKLRNFRTWHSIICPRVLQHVKFSILLKSSFFVLIIFMLLIDTQLGQRRVKDKRTYSTRKQQLHLATGNNSLLKMYSVYRVYNIFIVHERKTSYAIGVQFSQQLTSLFEMKIYSLIMKFVAVINEKCFNIEFLFIVLAISLISPNSSLPLQ